MKRKLLLIGLNITACVLFLFPSLVSLSAAATGGGVLGLTNPLKDQTLAKLVETILGAVAEIGIVVVTGSIIFAGFNYVTARGNTTKIKHAHDGMLWTLAGSAIVLGAYAVRQIVMDTVTSIVK